MNAAEPGSRFDPTHDPRRAIVRGHQGFAISSRTRGERIFLLATASYLALAFATGGGSQDHGFDDAIVQWLALPFAAVAAWRLANNGIARELRWPIAVACAIVVLPLLQLLPLHPARVELARDLAVAGVHAPARWSLSRNGSLHAWSSLLPAFAIFLAACSLPREAHRPLLKLLAWLAGASLLLGFIQLGLPQDSVLNPFPQWSPALGGVFANPNHQAIMLGIGAVIAFLLGREAWSNAARRRTLPVLALWSCGLACVAALPMTGSRAGLLISLAALAAAVLLRDPGSIRSMPMPRKALVAAAAMFGLAAVFLAWRWMQVDAIDENRSAMRAATWALGWRHAPLGAGFGSFVPLFEQEGPARLLGPEFINHAHNEYVQWWLEGGVPAALLLAGALVLLGSALRRLWRMRARGRQDAPALACALGIAMLLAHSWVDFPLRTPALMSVAAVLCALLFVRSADRQPRRAGENARETPPARHN